MKFNEKAHFCKAFFKQLGYYLDHDKYKFYSTNGKALGQLFHHSGRMDCYLVPKDGMVTYYNHPVGTVRISNHWSWYASEDRCADLKRIQCFNADLPMAKPRSYEYGESTPILAFQVAVMKKDGKYHCLFGERFNRETKEWEWINTDPEYVAIFLNSLQ